MRGGRVADFIHALHNGVEGRVITYGRVSAVKVIVNGSGQTDDGKVELVGENTRAGKRTVTTDHHECIYFMSAEIIVSELTPLGCLELGAARGFQDCATHLNDI